MQAWKTTQVIFGNIAAFKVSAVIPPARSQLLYAGHSQFGHIFSPRCTIYSYTNPFWLDSQPCCWPVEIETGTRCGASVSSSSLLGKQEVEGTVTSSPAISYQLNGCDKIQYCCELYSRPPPLFFFPKYFQALATVPSVWQVLEQVVNGSRVCVCVWVWMLSIISISCISSWGNVEWEEWRCREKKEGWHDLYNEIHC